MTLACALALGAVSLVHGPMGAQAPEVPVIDHQPLRCLIKGRYTLIAASVRPPEKVTRARVYFTSSAGEEYSVELRHTAGEHFEARLPKPKQEAGPVTYLLEVISSGGEVQRTLTTKVDVVASREACPEPNRAGTTTGGSAIVIYAATPRSGKPKGFGGVARVLASPDAVPTPPPPTPVPPAGGAEPTGPGPAGTPAPTPAPASEPVEYAVGPEDIVKIVVVGHDDLSQTLIVQSDGTFIFPLLGRLRVADQTPSQIEALLSTRLSQGYIRNPQVSVSVQEYRSKTVMVMGEVARPGPYPLSGSSRIIEMLAKAGMTSAAGYEVQVIRPLGATDRPLMPSEVAGAEGAPPTANRQAEILKIDLRAIQTGELEKNIPLRPNDTVFVPPAAKFYVTGEARSPGAYTLTAGLTVREAVILAGGFSDNAAAGRTRVIREADGRKREIKVRLDDPVQAGDVIVVKGKLF